jgi:hypothetical protein
LNIHQLVGTCDIVLVTLDTLRFDVAQECFVRKRIPNLSKMLPANGWERRHSPGSFTYSAHQAVFAGFLPTPITPGPHPRLFAARFEGSETTTPDTWVFETATWVEGLQQAGYHTICIGGVGFFSKQNKLCSVLPELFDESHWSPEMGVTSSHSMENQVRLAVQRLRAWPANRRLVLFINVSAIHQPNCLFGAHTQDSCETQAEALEYVDRCLPPLFQALLCRAPAFCLFFSDHGTAYGEDGYRGHRLAHRVVWDVPYAQFLLEAAAGEAVDA